jgi:type IV pilus assembly protein PilM
LTSSASIASQFFELGLVRRMDRWLNAMPHPPLAVEIASTHVAAARCGKVQGKLESFAMEPLPPGAILSSPVEVNIAQPEEVRSVFSRVLNRVPAREEGIVLLIPDPVVRVFILPFDNLPRRADEALPLLRWRLKKSVPFDVDETVVSWTRQGGREGNLEVVAAVARQRIVREYEEIVKSANLNAGVVISSTLAALPLIDERGAAILVRMSGRTLTTVIVRENNLCVYRSTELAGDAQTLEPQAILDEIFPAIAYYQDTWGGMVDRAHLSGLGARQEIFRRALSEELKCPVASLAESEGALHLDTSAKDLLKQNLDALAGWMMNRGS